MPVPRPPFNREEILSDEDPVRRLLAIMALLRGTDGCPWDQVQTLETLKPFLVEEAYEVLDAIDSGSPKELCGELGDLLLQIVFQCQIAQESGWFDFQDVARGLAGKLIRRHPHVFGTESAKTPDEVVETWEAVKKTEGGGLLDGIPRHMPALLKAYRIGQKTTRVGFDWPDVSGALDKVQEEAAELVAARSVEERKREVGDLLIAVANVARWLDIDPEQALQQANHRFAKRFKYVETSLAAEGRSTSEATLEEMDRLWEEAKKFD